jgi:hypothetical protein
MTTAETAHEDGSREPSSEARSPKESSLVTLADAESSAIADTPGSRDVNRAESSSVTESDQLEAITALPQVLKIVGSIVAPTTLLTALLFYFGLMYAIGYFQYFGVNYTVLNLPFQEYLILSSDGSIIPLIYAAGAALLALWLYRLPLKTLTATARWIVLHAFMPSAAIAGLVLVILAMVDSVFGIPVFPITFWEARGLSLSIGVLLLACAARLRRVLTAERQQEQAPRRVPATVVVAKSGAVFILVSVGLFWTVGSYAVGVGQTIAQDFAANLTCAPDVVLYSEKNLNLQAPGIREATGQSPDAAYRFRYEGLKLVPQSGNQYLFVSAGWTQADGTAILLPRSDALRLEFSLAGRVRNPAC